MKEEKKAGICPTCGCAMESKGEGSEEAKESADLKTMLSKEISRRFSKKGK